MSLTTQQRALLVANVAWVESFESLFAYDQARPFPVYGFEDLASHFGGAITVRGLDCSAFIILMYKLAGLADPSGFNFDGHGNTQSMLDRLPHYTNPLNAHAGAIVIFNADLSLGEQHAAMVVAHSADPMVVTHGSPGVQVLALSELQTGFTGKTVFLDVSSL